TGRHRKSGPGTHDEPDERGGASALGLGGERTPTPGGSTGRARTHARSDRASARAASAPRSARDSFGDHRTLRAPGGLSAVRRHERVRGSRMRLARRLRAAALVLGVTLAETSPALAQKSVGDKAAAEALFDQAKRLAATGRYEEACLKFAESQKLDA